MCICSRARRHLRPRRDETAMLTGDASAMVLTTPRAEPAGVTTRGGQNAILVAGIRGEGAHWMHTGRCRAKRLSKRLLGKCCFSDSVRRRRFSTEL